MQLLRMMMFFYSDNEPRMGNPPPYHKQNATKSYLTHYDNLLFLTFLLANSNDRAEKQQASKEMTICERKLKHWTHHANYNHADAMRGIQELRKKWKSEKR
jgi:hypothetical protein